MTTPFISYSFCNGIKESEKLLDYEYFLITVLFVKTKKMPVKKLRFYCVQFCRNILRLFKNRSSRTRGDQNDTKFVFWMKNWFLGFIIPLTVNAKKANVCSPWTPCLYICRQLSGFPNNKIKLKIGMLFKIPFLRYLSTTFNISIDKDAL